MVEIQFVRPREESGRLGMGFQGRFRPKAEIEYLENRLILMSAFKFKMECMIVKCGGLRCSHPTTDMELLDMKESNELRASAGRRIQERRSRERRSAESEYRACGFDPLLCCVAALREA